MSGPLPGPVVSGAFFAALVAMAPVAADAQVASPPLPPARPGPIVSEAPDPPLPPARPASPTQAAGEAQPKGAAAAEALAEPADPECPGRLGRLGVAFDESADVGENGCSVRQAVLVSRLPDGLEVSPPSLMTCPLAEGLARWTLDVLSVEADRHFGSAPTKLLIGTSYQCRNQRSGTRLSEHAFGNAVDVMGFAFATRPSITVGAQPDGSPEAAFQDAVRKGACASFTTVLGPGADADHGDHLHLDRRDRNRGFRICQ
jgi:hypothetical protein